MIKIPFEEVISKIKEKSSLNEEQIEEKIKQKLDQLSGLISREGAAHIIANELGVKLYDQLSGRMKINKLLPGMREVEIVGKTVQIFDIKEFQKSEGTGMVGSFIVGDETATTRVVCWGEKAKILKELEQDIVVKISNAYVRENNGRKEVHCNDKTSILLRPTGEVVERVLARPEATRKLLSELKENEANIEVLGTIVQIFDLKFYNICPECRRKLLEENGAYLCQTHDRVNPSLGYILNLVIDDGTATLRAVLFNRQVEQLINKTPEEMLNYKTTPDLFENIKTELLGEYIKLRGRAQRNSLFDRIEVVANSVLQADPNEEIERLKKEQQSLS